MLVKGFGVGKTFPLQGKGEEWLIGRRQGADICLDYDPFLSDEHSLIVEDNGFCVRSLAEAGNGTYINFRRLKDSQAYPLRTGDIVGVGQSLLVYRR